MPPPIDLTGQTFGMLSVIKFTGAFHTDKKRSRIWLCRCNQCGRDEEIPQNLLPYVPSKAHKRGIRYACSVCSRGACVVCGGEITRDTNENTCSDACHEQKIKNIQNLHYAKRVANDPDFNKKRHERVRVRMASDPEFAARVREIRREANKRYQREDEAIKARREYQAAWWQERKEALIEQRNRFWRSLSVEEQAERLERRRDSGRESKRRFYEWLRANPAERQQYIERQRAYQMGRNRRIELAKLQSAMEEIKGIKSE